MYRPEEYIALIVFLVDTILTGQLAAALRQRAQNASRRERETHILYDLVRVVNIPGVGYRFGTEEALG